MFCGLSCDAEVICLKEHCSDVCDGPMLMAIVQEFGENLLIDLRNFLDCINVK